MNSSKRQQLTLRLPEILKEKIETKANEMGVSINAYIIMKLMSELKENNLKEVR